MKMKKYILGLALVAGGLLTSCDTDNVATVYETTAANISFADAEPATVTTKASTVSVPVVITRSNTAETYTVHYTLSSDDSGIFTDKNGGQATFQAGEWQTTITIEAANMQGGTEYACTLALSATDAASADTTLNKSINAETYITVLCDYNWTSLGMGNFKSDMFEDEWEVEVQKADGVGLYKAIDLYEDGLDMNFQILDDNTVIVPEQHTWNYGSYGKVWAVGNATGDYDGVAGTYDPATKTVTMYLCHYVSAGSFGTEQETLVLP